MLALLRLILIFPYCAFALAVGILVCLVRPFHPNNVHTTSRLFRHGRKILGLDLEIEGLEYLENDSPAVIISNHVNNYDMISATQILPARTVSLGKWSVVWIPIFGIFYWLSGNILVKRENRQKAMKSMGIVRKKIIDGKLKVWILPEGHRSFGRGLLPFKKGAFYTAIQTQVPIIPIVFNDYHGKFNLNKWNSGTIRIKILPPIETTGMTVKDVNRLLDKCYRLISKTIPELENHSPSTEMGNLSSSNL